VLVAGHYPRMMVESGVFPISDFIRLACICERIPKKPEGTLTRRKLREMRYLMMHFLYFSAIQELA